MQKLYYNDWECKKIDILHFVIERFCVVYSIESTVVANIFTKEDNGQLNSIIKCNMFSEELQMEGKFDYFSLAVSATINKNKFEAFSVEWRLEKKKWN